MKKSAESVSTAVRMVRDELTGTLRPVGERPVDYELTSVGMHVSIGTLYDCAAGWKVLRVGRIPEAGDNSVELKYSADGQYPDDSKSTRRLLVLSPDGDTELPKEMRRRLCIGPDNADSAIGIQLWTGEVVHVAFIGEKEQHGCPEEGIPFHMDTVDSAIFWPIDPQGPVYMPRSWLARLDDLKAKPAPYRLLLPERLVWAFIDREAGYQDLRGALIVDFDFGDRHLEVSRDGYRETTPWRRATASTGGAK